MNTPSNKRYSSSSEYGTPGAVDDLENSLYYSFTADDNPTNKENSINGGQWAITDLSASSSASTHVLKAKTPLLRKVLQANFTPRNKNNKRVSFSHLPKECSAEETSGKMAKTIHTNEHRTELNSDTMFDLKPIKESLPCSTMAIDQKQFNEIGNDQDANSDTADDLDDDMHNTIIENPLSVEQSTDSLAKIGEISELSIPSPSKIMEPIKTNDTPGKDSKRECEPPQVKQILSGAVLKPHQTRNVAKLNRRQLVKDNRKSVLPVAKKPARATTYKRRSSTYEPQKVKLSKSVSGE